MPRTPTHLDWNTDDAPFLKGDRVSTPKGDGVLYGLSKDRSGTTKLCVTLDDGNAWEGDASVLELDDRVRWWCSCGAENFTSLHYCPKCALPAPGMPSKTRFYEHFIARLRALRFTPPFFANNALSLAKHLEWRLEARHDGFDLELTDDEEAAREALAVWLDNAAHSPTYCAPSWGRNFSEAVAYVVRERLEGLDYIHIESALEAARQENRERGK